MASLVVRALAGERLTAVLGGLAVATGAFALRAARSSSIVRRRMLAGAATLSGLGLALGVWTRFVEPEWIQTTHTHLAWRGPRLRVVILADIHARPGGAKRTARIVRRANALAPDLVLLPGDFIEGLDADPAKLEALAPLAGLRARLGAFAVMGNHDSEPAENEAPRKDVVRECLENAHIRVLENEHVEVDGIVLVGIGSRRAHDSEPSEAFAGVDPSRPVVLLAHEHRSLDLPGVGRFDLAVAGHTHGGQGCVPFTGVCPFLEDDMKPYRRGLFTLPSGGRLYVSAGLGTSDIRARLGARPEIAVLQLLSTTPRARRRGRPPRPRVPAASRARRGDPSR